KTQPGFYRMMLGDFEVTALNDGVVNYPTARVLPTATSDQITVGLSESGHGSAFRPRSLLWAKDFRLVQGNESVADYSSSPSVHRTFCRNCGSPLIAFSDEYPTILNLPPHQGTRLHSRCPVSSSRNTDTDEVALELSRDCCLLQDSRPASPDPSPARSEVSGAERRASPPAHYRGYSDRRQRGGPACIPP
ncbi:MAG: hypothetical protein QOI59_2648, partial [Gammaproteobacteria bacterium]|nr:hypothetical protein [Gammaproteobacteria bacterium]